MPLESHPNAKRIAGRTLTLVVIASLALFLRYLGTPHGLGAATMLLGFLLLAAFVAGELTREFHLPRITGYLIAGIVFGPSVIGTLTRDTVEDFRLINGVALSIIALQAGGELRLARLRERLVSIGVITAFQIIAIIGGITAVVYLARDLLPFLAGQPNRSVLAVALIFGLVAVAKSPATTVAVITELRARGPFTNTVLGITVLKDVFVLLLIAALVPAAAVLVDPAVGFELHAMQEIGQAMILSLVLGSVVGWLMALYLERVNQYPVLFVLAVAFVVVELAETLGLEYILLSMAAGFVVQNFSTRGPALIEALETNSLPLYALFFAVAGADLDLSVIPQVWQIGLAIIVARTLLIHASTYLGAVVVGDTRVMRRYAWMGFVAQAGVTLGLANMVRERFTLWGDDVAAIIIAMIAVNQLVGPPLFRTALNAAGESGAAVPVRSPNAVRAVVAAARRPSLERDV
jgi:Kef-type K+ transport system membrane component KefB